MTIFTHLFLNSLKLSLSAVSIDSLLRKKQYSDMTSTGNIKSISVAQLQANEKLEDNYTIYKSNNLDNNNSSMNSKVILLVADGHSGYECSEIISQKLCEFIEKNKIKILNTNPNATMEEILKLSFQEFDKRLMDVVRNTSANITINDKRMGISGSCVCLVYIDGDDLFVANTGDCRAILGYTTKFDSSIRLKSLSNDHTLSNKKELARYISEHPNEDPSVLTNKNRILGGLMPSRVFGDAKYKLPIDVVSKFTTPRKGYLTPPYVTAEPEIVHHKIRLGDKFLVVASDGLWDALSSKQVLELLQLHSMKFPLEKSDFGNDIEIKLEKKSNFVVHDANPATHLIRNAIGPAYDKLDRQLSTKPPHARKIRDDITCIVAHL